MDEWRPLIEAAERAAADGDHTLAEDRLLEAARLQEAQLGPMHAELANTLNNLGVVSELRGKAAEAERYFRRAAAMAKACLAPDDPLVATSRLNLEEFCAARGIPLARAEAPVSAGPPLARSSPPARPAATPPAQPATPPPVPRATTTPAQAKAPATRSTPSLPAGPAPERVRPTTAAPPAVASAPAAPGGWSGATVAGLLVAAGILVYVVAFRESGSNQDSSSSGDVTASTPTPSAPVSVPEAVTTTPPPSASTPAAGAGATRETSQTAKAPASSGGVPVPPAGQTRSSTTIVDARLCRSLTTSGAEWTCTPADESVEAGRLVFYTRVRTPTDTSVQHRWYRDGGLRQEVELSVRANTGAGYRTYSRHVVDAAGPWRIEVRAADGTVLHEERFLVR
jgi:hypothetical protein